MRRSLMLLPLLAACHNPGPPAPTVALAESARPGVTLSRGNDKAALTTSRRVEEGAVLGTPDAGRASLRLDGGSWALLDAKSRVKVGAGQLTLEAGRVWIDARGVEPIVIAVPGGTLTATQAGFAVELGSTGARAYCVSGQLTYAAKSSNRLEAGMTVAIGAGGEAKEEPESQWDDWTGGLAEPGPPRPQEPAGVGQLAARRSDEIGAARSTLLIRRHDVRAMIDQDRVITDVEQVFFNPRSETVDGIYSLRLQSGAILSGFEISEGETIPIDRVRSGKPRIVPIARQGSQAVALEWAGPDRYRARVPNIGAGKTVVARVRYVEWLARRGERRTWTYAMGGDTPPLLGELSLEVDTTRSGAKAFEAGMGARVEAHRVILRKSDFRPRSDFALDLLDEKAPPAHVYTTTGTTDGVGKGYALVSLDPPFGAPPSSLDLVLVVDVSAGTDPTRLDLEKAVVDGILRQLTPGDRVAVLAASVDAQPLGGEGLAPLAAGRSEALLEALARKPPSGATDLGKTLAAGAKLLAGGKGALVYVGDGRPTVGALTPGALKDELVRLGSLPRLFTVGVGADARMDLLCTLSEGGLCTHVEDRPEAAHAAYRVLAAAALPTLRQVTYDLGPTVDVAYPAGPLTLVAGEPLRLSGRLRGAAPKKVTLSGLRDGKPFTVDVPLTSASVEDNGDVRRRWSAGRLNELLARGAGAEAVTEIGTRFGLVTPWSAMLASGAGGIATYRPIAIESSGTFVPQAERDRAPEDGPIALEDRATSAPSGSSDLTPLYARLLGEHDEGVRVCYDKKAASHPELSGRIELKIKIGLAGEIASAAQLSSTLRDSEVEACVLRAVKAMRLPPPPDQKVRELTRAWLFEAEDGRLGANTKCSTASRQYLAVRRALWRERLASNPGVEGAMAVWRQASRACELKTWLDRRSLLDLLRPHVGRTLYQIDLYHRFERYGDVQAHLRREILRSVRTADDVAAIRAGLSLDGGVSAELLEAQLKRAPDAGARLKVVRQFLALAPEGIALRLRLLALLEETSAFDEAKRVAFALRGDPAADSDARQSVGEFFARRGDADEAARAFSEIVEMAPYDPWARRRLGNLYRAHGRYEDAYREYGTLAWLVPNDASVPLLLAQAAAGAGRIDEALRLEERVAEAVDAKGGGNDAPAWARHLHALRLAALRDDARKAGDKDRLAQLAARTRSAGVLTWAMPVMVGLTWPHPDARLELAVAAPGDALLRRAPVQGGSVNIEALRLPRQAAGTYKVVVRRGDSSRKVQATLWVLFDEAQTGEKLVRIPIELPAGALHADFTLSGREVLATR